MIGERHENESRNYVARMYRGTRSASPFRRYYECSPIRSSLHTRTSRTGVQKEVFAEPAPTRPKTKAQAFGPRFPRQGLVFRFSHLAGELLIGKALAHYLRNCKAEPLAVIHVQPIIEAKSLLID